MGIFSRTATDRRKLSDVRGLASDANFRAGQLLASTQAKRGSTTTTTKDEGSASGLEVASTVANTGLTGFALYNQFAKKTPTSAIKTPGAGTASATTPATATTSASSAATSASPAVDVNAIKGTSSVASSQGNTAATQLASTVKPSGAGTSQAAGTAGKSSWQPGGASFGAAAVGAAILAQSWMADQNYEAGRPGGVLHGDDDDIFGTKNVGVDPWMGYALEQFGISERTFGEQYAEDPSAGNAIKAMYQWAQPVQHFASTVGKDVAGDFGQFTADPASWLLDQLL